MEKQRDHTQEKGESHESMKLDDVALDREFSKGLERVKQMESLDAHWQKSLDRISDSDFGSIENDERIEDLKPRLKEALGDIENLDVDDMYIDEKLESGLGRFSEDSSSERQIGEITSKDDLDSAIEHHSEVRLNKHFEKQYKTSVENLENESGAKSDLVSKLERLEKRRLYEAEHGSPPDVTIESMEDIDDLMKKNGFDNSGTDESYRHCEVYFAVRNNRSETQLELAEKYNVSQSTVGNYRQYREPSLASRLRRVEEDAIIDEWAKSIHDEGLTESIEAKHEEIDTERFRSKLNESVEPGAVKRIKSEYVKEVFSNSEISELAAENIADRIEDIYRQHERIESKLYYADISSVDGLEDKILQDREKIEDSLRKRLQMDETDLDIRLGAGGGRMYIWTPKLDLNDMVSVWDDQYFYYKSRALMNLSDSVGSQLNLSGSLHENISHLEKITKQMTGDSSSTIKIKDTSSRITGEVTQFHRDALGISNKHLEGQITRVTGPSGQGGIRNPKLNFEKSEIERIRAHSIATAVSDCHIRKSGKMEYYEENLDRVERFQDVTRQFGDSDNEVKFRKRDNLYYQNVASPIGKALLKWGLKPGDRTIENHGLPEDAPKWDNLSKAEYLKAMVAQDGTVARNRVKWHRSHTLHAGDKSDAYGFEPRISQKEVDLIRSIDNPFTSKSDKEIQLYWGGIKKLMQSDDESTRTTARELYDTILRNRNKLIDDEANMATDLGMDIDLRPRRVTFYKKSERVSIQWEAKTADIHSTIQWGIDCNIDHREKSEKLQRIVSKQSSEDIELVRKRNRSKGRIIENY
ncbi:MAG: hypothetical protein RTU92_00605 [Candidatus Thorarchaeota archaeon]